MPHYFGPKTVISGIYQKSKYLRKEKIFSNFPLFFGRKAQKYNVRKGKSSHKKKYFE
jgi:hypothetical protein